MMYAQTPIWVAVRSSGFTHTNSSSTTQTHTMIGGTNVITHGLSDITLEDESVMAMAAIYPSIDDMMARIQEQQAQQVQHRCMIAENQVKLEALRTEHERLTALLTRVRKGHTKVENKRLHPTPE